ncbi:MAG: hypothetical protein CMM54_04575 [Rhodospirillaceae bacterium]|nr:hypothetical protein [Rhodospirillaceae bacterium]
MLFDYPIAEILKMSGVDISRWTIAKYHVSMGISSSVQRCRKLTKTSRR